MVLTAQLEQLEGEIAKREAYNWKRDFVPITSITMTPLVLEVHPSVAAKDLKEFIELARSEPGKLTMASPGQGTTNHLLSELMQSSLDLQWVTAHYRGNVPSIEAYADAIMAAMNYRALSTICDDPEEVADALEHAQGEQGHAAAFAADPCPVW